MEIGDCYLLMKMTSTENVQGPSPTLLSLFSQAGIKMRTVLTLILYIAYQPVKKHGPVGCDTRRRVKLHRININSTSLAY